MKLSTLIRSGYTHAVLAAIFVSCYVLTNRYSFAKNDFDPLSYASWFLIFSGTFAFIDLIAFNGLSQSRMLLFSKDRKVERSSGKLIFFGTVASFAFLLLVLGQQNTTAKNASVILAANMVPTAFFSWLVLRRVISKFQVMAMGVVLIGLYLAVMGLSSFNLKKGDLLIIVAAVIIGFTNSYMKLLMGKFTAKVVADMRLMTGGFLALIFLFITNGWNEIAFADLRFPLISGFFFWLSVLVLSSAVSKIHANEAVVITQLHILSTPVVAIFLLNEKYELTVFIGSLIMLAGVVAFSRDGHSKRKSADVPSG